MTQQRWLCADCGREWLGLAETLTLDKPEWKWRPEKGCPGCQSLAIAEVLYTPEFRGGDIRRSETPVLTAEQRAAVDAEPPAPPMPAWEVLPPFAPTAPVTDDERRTQALAVSSPEFG